MTTDFVPRLRRYGSGFYMTINTTDNYLVQRCSDGWHWRSERRPDISGEWRSTKKDAVADLTEYLRKHGAFAA